MKIEKRGQSSQSNIWKETDAEYNLQVFAGPKGSDAMLYYIDADEPISFFNIGDVIDTRLGRTPGFADLEGGSLFEVIGIEKGIRQTEEGKSINFTTLVYTKPTVDK